MNNEFETKLLSGVESLQTDGKAMKQEVATLSESTKSAIAEINKVKVVANDLTQKLQVIEKANLSLRNDITRANGDPLQRIMRDEQKAMSVLRALANAAKPFIRMDQMKPETRTALYEGATPGSTFISGEVARDVYDVLGTYGIWNTFGVKTMGAYTQTMPIQTARAVALALLTGATQITADATKGGTSVSLTPIDVGVLIGVARSLIEDADLDVVADVLRDFSEAVAYRLDWFCTSADGGSDTTDGGFTGVASGGTAATAADGNTTVSKLDLDDFIRGITTPASGVLRRACKWWIHPTILAKICGLEDGNGRPIFQNALEAPAPNAIGSILGYPVVIADAMPSTDSAGSVVAVFGDPQGLGVGVRRSFEFAASEHFYFDYNQIAYRGLARAGVVIRRATAFGMLTTAAA
jgi:HK97 family phage major capsid protein